MPPQKDAERVTKCLPQFEVMKGYGQRQRRPAGVTERGEMEKEKERDKANKMKMNALRN